VPATKPVLEGGMGRCTGHGALKTGNSRIAGSLS
jgi:hypothetical protein